ncbi:MAG: methyltransferase domain-containing protein [Spirochaetes bacterium]|nr:methyltransferase domain-containing protein [Spirochaetota bacterium]
MSDGPEKIYFVTAIGGRYGRGHFTRSVILAHFLQDKGYLPVFVAEPNSELYTKAEDNGFEAYSPSIIASTEARAIIVDKRETPPAVIRELKRTAPVIVIDSLGPETAIADIVIDELPAPETKRMLNIRPFECTVLAAPGGKKRTVPANVRHVFVYLGSDAPLLAYAEKLFAPFTKIRFTVVSGAVERETRKGNIKFRPFDEHTPPRLSFYDAVITYFGLTAFEAIMTGVPTAVLAPTEYHASLASLCGDIFFDLGYYRNTPVTQARDQLVYFFNKHEVRTEKIAAAKKIHIDHSLAALHAVINGSSQLRGNCIACGTPLKRIVARAHESNLYHCSRCATLNRRYFLPLKLTYERDYFTTQYRAQYGRTYEDDIPAIRLMARRRIAVMKELLPRGRILDAGCALGFFLLEARDAGYEPYGIEISSFAANYAKRRFDIDVRTGGFEKFDIGEPFNAVTAWYFLEHTDDIRAMIQKIHALLAVNGVLAFAMPNARGISAILNRKHYRKSVPVDHRAEFTPESMDRLLRQEGFVRERAVATGIHWQRFLKLIHLPFLEKAGVLEMWYRKIAETFLLGDTFEGYYRKR